MSTTQEEREREGEEKTMEIFHVLKENESNRSIMEK